MSKQQQAWQERYEKQVDEELIRNVPTLGTSPTASEKRRYALAVAAVDRNKEERAKQAAVRDQLQETLAPGKAAREAEVNANANAIAAAEVERTKIEAAAMEADLKRRYRSLPGTTEADWIRDRDAVVTAERLRLLAERETADDQARARLVRSDRYS
jgi:vancomycin resistance protein YoaR